MQKTPICLIFTALYLVFSSFSAPGQGIPDSLAGVLKAAQHDTTRIQVYLALSEELIESKPDTVITLCVKALELADRSLHKANPKEKKVFLYLKSSALNNTGYVYSKKGESILALEYYQSSLKLKQEIGDTEGSASILNNIAGVYEERGDVTKALDFYHEGLKICERTGNKEWVSGFLNNIGYIHNTQGDTKKALEYFLKALKIKEEIGDRRTIANALNNIGFVYSMRGEKAQALEYYNKSLELHRENGNKRGMGQAFNNIGGIHKDLGAYAPALENYEKSLSVREEVKDKRGIAIALLNIGDVHFRQKNYAQAEANALRSLDLSKELGFPAEIRNTAYLLFQVYEAREKHKDALEMHKLFKQMADSVNNVETKKAAIKSQVKYEFEKKEAEALAKQEKKDLEAAADKRKQELITGAIAMGLLIVLIFSGLLFNRFRLTKRQKRTIEEQKFLVEEKNRDITDSINYARRIQRALLASDAMLEANLGASGYFVLFKPKDIVSGDFYWAIKKEGRFYLAVCDSTGHGVPGAFMSLLNISFMNEAIREQDISKPCEVFDHARQQLIANISSEGARDGMDGILLSLDANHGTVAYAAAHNAPLLVRNGEAIELKTDKMPVGLSDHQQAFTHFTEELAPNDMLYLYTDGYADQFGGPKGKKFKYKQLETLLVSISSKPLAEQKNILEQTIEEWKGGLEQVDDILLVGIRK